MLHSHCADLIVDLMPDVVCQNTKGLLNQLCVYEGLDGRDNDNTSLSTGKARNHIMAGSEGIFYKSDDRGASFREIVPDWGDEEALRHGLTRTFAIGYGNIFDIIYAQGALVAAADLNRIFVSYDRGETWVYNPHVFDLRVGGKKLVGSISYPVDFTGIAYGDGVYIAVSSRTGIFRARNPMGHFERVDCNTLTEVPESQGRCNMFFRGVAYGAGHFVIWGSGQAHSTVNVLLYSDDRGSTWHLLSQAFYVDTVKFYRGRWYYSGKANSSMPDFKFLISIGRSGLRYTETAHPASNYHIHPYWLHPRAKRADAGSLSVFGLGDDEVKLIGSSRDSSYLTIDDGTGIRNCRENTTEGGNPDRLCDIFDPYITGGHTDIIHTNGLWRIITTDGYYYYSEKGYRYTQIRPTLQSLNAIIGY